MVVPKTAAMMVAPKAISSEMRMDSISRLNTSRPSSSVPSGCAQVPPKPIGGWSRARRSMAVMP